MFRLSLWNTVPSRSLQEWALSAMGPTERTRIMYRQMAELYRKGDEEYLNLVRPLLTRNAGAFRSMMVAAGKLVTWASDAARGQDR